MRIPEIIKNVASTVEAKGGTCFLVGGCIVDSLLGIPPKDWDVEVHGLSIENLETILQDAGYRVKEIGKAFGILTLCDLNTEIDVSIPRVDNRMGKGHKDFQIEFDPDMTPEEAARRRDFTINAMLMRVSDGVIVDPYGGQEDLKKGILRATDAELFPQDPLRALRAMQLLARKAKTVDPETLEICKSMVDEFPNLAKERVYEEFFKLLMKADKPSVGLRFLADCGWIKHFPELEALIDCQQNPEWHPEGDVWEHTLLVVDHAASVRHMVNVEDRTMFMFSALCHDLGKPACSDDSLTSHGHDTEGEAVAMSFMSRLTNSNNLLKFVPMMTKAHMQPFFLSREDENGKPLTGDKAWKRLYNRVEGKMRTLAWLSLSDWAGSNIPGSRSALMPNVNHTPSVYCFDWSDRLEKEGTKISPILQGRDLIVAGKKPGREFGDLLNKAYEAQLDGENNKDRLLEIALS